MRKNTWLIEIFNKFLDKHKTKEIVKENYYDLDNSIVIKRFFEEIELKGLMSHNNINIYLLKMINTKLLEELYNISYLVKTTNLNDEEFIEISSKCINRWKYYIQYLDTKYGLDELSALEAINIFNNALLKKENEKIYSCVINRFHIDLDFLQLLCTKYNMNLKSELYAFKHKVSNTMQVTIQQEQKDSNQNQTRTRKLPKK